MVARVVYKQLFATLFVLDPCRTAYSAALRTPLVYSAVYNSCLWVLPAFAAAAAADAPIARHACCNNLHLGASRVS